ncbi:MAG: hypothetical protein ACOCVT_02990 [bacterium]
MDTSADSQAADGKSSSAAETGKKAAAEKEKKEAEQAADSEDAPENEYIYADAEPWPEPEYLEGIPRIVRWHNLYAFMGMTPEWAAEQGEGEDGWETPGLLDKFLDGPMKDVEEVVYAIREAGHDWHWYANFGYAANNPTAWLIGDGAQLVRHNLRTGEQFVILDDPKGDIRDPYVEYEGESILFSYRPGDEKHFHLYRIRPDGTGLTQLTDGDYDDIEPILMPNNEIMFCSTRSLRWVPCWHTQVATIYRADADGSNIRVASINVETDNTPWVMPDGQILYTRWEYVDRDQNLSYHHLWVFRPDGTGVMTYFGNQFSGMLLIDAKPIPGSDRVVCTSAPGHGRNEHAGAVTIIDPDRGPDELTACKLVSRPEPERPPYGWHKDEHRWRDPWAFSEDCFLVARERSLCVMDGEGRYETLVTLDYDKWPKVNGNSQFMIHEPRPLIVREREPVLPEMTDWDSPTGTMVLSDAHLGRKMDGVEPGEIKKLLVLEVLPKPINYFGGADQNAVWPTYFIYRNLGTVPVEPDGSAHFELPATRPIFFVALDKNDMAVKRMQSFTGVMPGENLSCVGCHENRTRTPDKPGTSMLQALQRPASKIEPVPGTPDIFHYPRDIQPVLDKHCVSCHNYDKFAGKVVFTSDRGLSYINGYHNLFEKKQVKVAAIVGNQPPRALGSSASPLLQKLSGGHHGVKASPEEIRLVRTWIDAGAIYTGTYASLGRGMITFRQAPLDMMDAKCGPCHPGGKDKRGRPRLNKMLANGPNYNLSDPDKSLLILAPLAKEAGGLGLCRQRKAADKPAEGEKDAAHAVVFASKDDPDYQTLLASLGELKHWYENEITSVVLDDFRPSDGYIRELKRYGVIAEDFDIETDPVKPFEWDDKYWRLFWHQPQ